MAVYKVRVPTGVRSYKVSMPTGVRKYKVSFPTAALEGTIQIHMDIPAEAPPGASWTLADSVSDVATGTGSVGPDTYPYETYTLTWEDTAFPWIPPPPEVEILNAGNPIIDFGPP